MMRIVSIRYRWMLLFLAMAVNSRKSLNIGRRRYPCCPLLPLLVLSFLLLYSVANNTLTLHPRGTDTLTDMRHSHQDQLGQDLGFDATLTGVPKMCSAAGNCRFSGRKFGSYSEALVATARKKDRVVYLSYVDNGALDMAMNFYVTSIYRHNITNILFLSSSVSLCDSFMNHEIACFVYAKDSSANKESVYGTRDFFRKMNIRTFMILDALYEGYNIIHTDVDMFFFQDPWMDIQKYCGKDCDIAPLLDGRNHNAGFLYIRNSTMSIAVYTEMKRIAIHTSKDDQNALNLAVNYFKKTGLKIRSLPTSKFQCGKTYFASGHRKFVGDNPCKTCVVVHNNWIISMESKVYRFKELGMWMYDQNGYYTSPTRKYLTYGNPSNVVKGKVTWREEKDALLNALAIGELLNRTVILPRFSGNKSSLREKIRMIYFDKAFGNQYRESTFLSHPLVPESVKRSQSEQVLIMTDKIDNTLSTATSPDIHRVLKPYNRKDGASSVEILRWFGQNQESVLRFHSLYHAFCGYSSKSKRDEFRLKCKKAFQYGKRHMVWLTIAKFFDIVENKLPKDVYEKNQEIIEKNLSKI